MCCGGEKEEKHVCIDKRQFLMFSDGWLNLWEMEEFQKKINKCPACKKRFEQFKKLAS